MGITGELVRGVFSRNRSVGTHESNGRIAPGDHKKRWSSVRLYLCGEELNSVLAEEDSASVKSSEATVTQPVLEDSEEKGDVENGGAEEDMPKEKHNSTSRLFRQEDAAITIQSAFRDFLTRHKREETKSEEDGQGLALGTESPSRDSLGTSIEVQTGNSVGVLSVKEENVSAHHRVQKRARTQVFRLKEDWDDSTVISNISTKRIQNRLEATNRRERALAYAFSQQLRICSKKKQTKSDGTQPSMSWSWLERWMATRVPECSVESCTGKQLEPVNSNYTFDFGERFSDVAVEEKESCGSNEVSVQFDSLSIASNNKDGFKHTKSRLTRTISRRKTAPSYQCPTDQAKTSNSLGLPCVDQVIKKRCSKEIEQDKEQNPKPPSSGRKDMKCSASS
ncbi:IQ-DOMAIN 5-RELATED [Salix purpurea]|uniref:IQ-DOMAIN 5-RELATED n=1 Tax=Salix purpurea TaxID=77065 RepID=A0A9Q0P2Q9_SALPP|nr:IQ-DOMAIN 5-RELATED [Salix purpurea]